MNDKSYIGKVAKFSGNNRIHIELPVDGFSPGDAVRVIKILD